MTSGIPSRPREVQRRAAHAINARWQQANRMVGLQDIPDLNLCGAGGNGVPLLERGNNIVIPGPNGEVQFWWDDAEAAFKDMTELRAEERMSRLNEMPRPERSPGRSPAKKRKL